MPMAPSNGLISVEDAWQLIAENARVLPSTNIPVSDSLGHALAADIAAPLDLPPFDNSAVDGFALSSPLPLVGRGQGEGGESTPQLKLAGTIAAGDIPPERIAPNEIWRIMTGAAVPSNCYAVVKQEEFSLGDSHPHPALSRPAGEGIRRAGEDIRMGEVALRRGMLIQPQHIGLLHALGLTHIPIHPRPRVAILSTGSELIDPGQPLKPGQVYYCTGTMLAAACQQVGASVCHIQKVADDFEQTRNAISSALATADVLLVTGGMGEGAFDYVTKAFDHLGVKKIFHGGKWRPGKPLFFGDYEGRPVFGIPGNPVACFVVFEIFVKSLLQTMSGKPSDLNWKTGMLIEPFIKKQGWAVFSRASINDTGDVVVLPGQGSHQLAALAKANALCWLQREIETIGKGDCVQFVWI